MVPGDFSKVRLFEMTAYPLDRVERRGFDVDYNSLSAQACRGVYYMPVVPCLCEHTHPAHKILLHLLSLPFTNNMGTKGDHTYETQKSCCARFYSL